MPRWIALGVICALVGCGGATEIDGSVDGGGPVEGGEAVDADAAQTGPCAAADVAGAWSLTYEPTGDGCHAAAPPGSVTLGVGAGGLEADVAGSHLTAPDVTFRPETCEVELKWSWSGVISGEMNGETGDLTLRLAGDRGHGTLDLCRYWACSSGCAPGRWSVDAQS